MRISRTVLVLIVISSFIFQTQMGLCCTVAVISGKATPDGRPLLWKNRDAMPYEQRVVHFKGEKYNYIGIVDDTDKEYVNVFAGMNSAGFCIMNSASFNLNEEFKQDPEGASKRKWDEECIFLKRALEICATVDDFEQLLNDTAGDRGTDANYGVIDAAGGAAMFEVEVNRHHKFDANDQHVAPEGYIIRSNYSFCGTSNAGSGYGRFDRTHKLFHQVAGGGIDRDWLLMTCSRDMVNDTTGIDPLAGPLPAHSRDRRMFFMNDSLARFPAISTAVFQGVRPGEDPAATIMWTRLGHPLCSVSLPLWVNAGENINLCGSNDDAAPMIRFSLALYDKIYPFKARERLMYMDLAPLANQSGDGFLPRLNRVDEEIFKATDAKLKEAELDQENLIRIQKEIENLALKLLWKEFPRECEKAGLSCED